MKDLLNKINEQNVLVEVVDGKLKVFAKEGSIAPDLVAAIKERKQELIEFLSAANLQNDHESLVAPIPTVPPAESYALSSGQRRLWILSQFEQGSTAYNMGGDYGFEGHLDREVFEKCFQALIERHESLRTVFREDPAGEVRQYILPVSDTGFALRHIDLRQEPDPAARLNELLQWNKRQPYDLAQGPLVRAVLYQLADTQWVLGYGMHHIISDGWSKGVMVKELLTLYQALSTGQPNPLPPLPIQYKDYAAWQQQQLQGGTLERHKDYWLQQFDGDLPVLELPGDRPRPAVKTYNGAVLSHRFGSGPTQALKALVQEQGGTLFMGVVTLVNALLHRYTGQEDIILGSPIAGRGHADLEGQIGFYINTLALRTRFKGTDSFKALLDNVRKTTLDAYQHQVYPFDELVEQLNIPRDMSRNQLFDVMVVLQNNESGMAPTDEPQAATDNPSSTDTGTDEGHTVSKFDLMFAFGEVGKELHFSIEYNRDIYSVATIQQLSAHLQQLLEQALRQPDSPVALLDYLTESEKRHLTEGLNATASAYDRTVTVVDLIEARAAAVPDSVALWVDDRPTSYGALNVAANRIAHWLRAGHGAVAEMLVGVQLERTEHLVAAMLGVLKSGAAYVPIDPSYPQDRIDYLIGDSRCALVIDQVVLEGFLREAENYPADNPVKVSEPQDLAYIIYTSGSTGHPKGVMIEHGNVSAFMHWCRKEFGGAAYEVMFAGTSVCFDVSIFEIFYTLTTGKPLRLLRDGLSIADYLGAHTGIMVNTVPSVVGALIRQGADFGNVTVLNMAGESIPEQYVAHFDCARIPLRNFYGPSEDTTYSTVYRLSNGAPVLIGRPIDNSQVYVVDAHGQLCPVGVVGEWWIGGDGVSRGYLHRPELTAERYMANPFGPGRLYKTGDMGRWQRDGNLALSGRRDTQVKVRGYRIELGEVETALQRHPLVEVAAVVVRANAGGERDMVGYVVASETLTADVLRAWLGNQLPGFMVPAYFVQLDAMPQTLNGKIDRKRLPDPGALGLRSGVEYVAPRNATEETLVGIWSDILGHAKEKISVKDNFFELGGHSLKATRLSSEIYRTFEVKLGIQQLFGAVILEQQAVLIDQQEKAVFTHIESVSVQERYPLSASQRRLWVLSQFPEGNVAYNMPGSYVFEGNLNRAALEQSFAALIERHEILRTVFKQDAEGNVHQQILAPQVTGFNIAYVDLRQHPNGATELDALVHQSSSAPFDLSQGPLIRAAIYQTADNQWVFAYCMHHIISDGWSMGILIKELLQLYNALSVGQPNTLAPLRIQYKDYAAWQQQQLQGEALERHKAYWLQQFAGELPVLELPGDRVRPVVKTYHGHAVAKSVNADLYDGLKALIQQEGSTLFMTLLASVNALLYRYTAQEDIILGTPAAGREHSDLHGQIGFYINTLALRTRFSGNDSFRQLLGNVKTVTLGAFDHQVYPFDELVDNLQLQKDTSRSPLFDVMVVLQNNDMPTAESGAQMQGVSIATYHGGGGTSSKYDLSFNFTETDGVLQAAVTYNTDIYEQPTAEALLTHWEQLLEQALRQPDSPVALLDYLTESEKRHLTEGLNATASAYDRTVTVVDLIEARAAAVPDSVALWVDDRPTSYGALNVAANRIAHWLRAGHGAVAEMLVGVQLERTEHLVAAMLGVLKSGAAYVPIDPSYPQDRIDYLIGDSRCALVIDQVVLEDFLREAENYPADNPVKVSEPQDLAYIIYTSGSTGHPKGVMIEHGNVSAFMHWCRKEFGGAAYEVMFAGTSVCFDVSIFEIFYTLTTGKPLRLLRDGLSIADYLGAHTGIMVNTVPSVVGALIRQGADFGNVTVLNMAGEAIPEQYVAHFDCARIPLRNFYGPSEDTTYSTVYRLSNGAPVLIGRPIDNSQVYVVDAHGQLCPVGVVGEWWIGGDGVSRGYLHRPELTAERYMANPFGPGRLYKTGDMGRWQRDGNLALSGRRDTQVKVRGYRIELGEVETALQRHPLVEVAAVVVRANAGGERDMVAYVVARETLTADVLRAHLGGLLPGFMVPAYFVQLDAMPQTLNGKIDRKRLPDPGALGMHSGVEYVAPRNATEETLVGIWSDILGHAKEKISVKDNFFELGGHSLKATRLAGRIFKELQVKLPLQDLFIHAVLETQAAWIAQTAPTAYSGIEALPPQTSYALSPSQRRLWVLSQFTEGNVAYNVPGSNLFPSNIDRQALAKAFDALIERHESLRTVFKEDGQGDVRQFILPAQAIGFQLGYEDLRGSEQQEAQVAALLQHQAAQPFDLAQGPLVRAALYEIDGGHLVLGYVLHHIISDGMSMNILANELTQLYMAFATNQPNPLPPLRIQYKDYAAWQLQQLNGEQLRAHQNYWLNQFAGELPVLDLPGDKKRPTVKTYNGGTVAHLIPSDLTDKLKKLSQAQGGTLFMGLLAAVNALLYKYTGQSDIIIGTQIAGREHVDLENQIGCYLNTLALRTQLDATQGFHNLLDKVKEVTLGAYAHQVYPFDNLVNELPLNRDMSRNPLFDVSVILHNTELDGTQPTVGPTGGMGDNPMMATPASSKFDWGFSFTETANGLMASLVFNADIYLPETAMRMMVHLHQLLEALVRQPALPLTEINSMDDAERQQLAAFNATASEYPRQQTLGALFDQQAAQTPDAVAWVFGDTTLTYRQLKEQTDQLAHHLQTNYRVGVNDLVGILLERSEYFIIAVLGILKSGAGYVPVDVEYPLARKTFILQDAAVKALVTIGRQAAALEGYDGPVVLLDTELANLPLPSAPVHCPATADSVAYVMYTSGSTGVPKGVMLAHRPAVRLAMGAAYLPFTGDEVLLTTAPVSFDTSIFEYFSLLLNGGKVIACGNDVLLDERLLGSMIRQHGVTTMWFTTGFINQLVERAPDIFEGLRTIVTGGDRISPPHMYVLRQRYPALQIINAYGPTENGTFSTTFQLDAISERIPVGKPFSNSTVYIVSDGQLAPIGIAGEICVGGDGLALGYLNRPDLTAEKFVPNPFAPGERMYKTGDLGRWLPDGNIEFLGRKDEQVKVRGYRIELGEIENALLQEPLVEAAAAVVKANALGEKEVVAYLVSSQPLSAGSLLAGLGQRLPAYMMPSHFVQLEALPLNANGKVDKKALPDPAIAGLGSGAEYVAPTNETEQRLVEIWQEILGREKIGIKDNFFDLGGHSLKATQLVSKITITFGVGIGIKTVFQEPTIESIAQRIQFILTRDKQKEDMGDMQEIEI